MYPKTISVRHQAGAARRGMGRAVLGALLLAAAWAHGDEFSEADLVQRLMARPAAPASAAVDDPEAAFANGGARSKSLGNFRAPDVRGACAPVEPASNGTRSKNLGIVALAPSGSPQVNLALQFEFASYRLTRTDQRQLDLLARALNSVELRAGRFTVAGHTDGSGDTLTNEKLSCARALSTRSYLIEHGVDAERVSAYGFGSNRPLNAGMSGAPENRRVEIRRAEG